MRKMIASLVVCGLLGAAPIGRSQESNSRVTPTSGKTLTFDVAIDTRTFRTVNGVNPFASNPPNISRGDTFIVDGKIYPGGTIPSGQGVFSPDMPGSIGTWVCRGVFLVSFAEIAAGAQVLVNTTQLFLLDDGSRLVSEGLEGPIPTMRAVTGGTGDLSGAAGDVLQETLGTNPTGLFNLHFTFGLKKSSLK
jgi:hypothetical protein